MRAVSFKGMSTCIGHIAIGETRGSIGRWGLESGVSRLSGVCLEVGLVKGLKRLGRDGERGLFLRELLLLIELLGVFGNELGLIHGVHILIIGRGRCGLGHVIGESFRSIKLRLGSSCWNG